MLLRYTPDARASIRYRQQWWRAHRDNAGLFARELRSVLHKIRDRTDVARQRYSGDGEATVWRLLLPKTRHHVYTSARPACYRRYELLVANAIAESGPDL